MPIEVNVLDRSHSDRVLYPRTCDPEPTYLKSECQRQFRQETVHKLYNCSAIIFGEPVEGSEYCGPGQSSQMFTEKLMRFIL